MRVTIRFNPEEELRLKQLQKYVSEDDLSKLIKFAIDVSLHHLEYVTQALVKPDWDVLFQRKRKTQELRRKVF